MTNDPLLRGDVVAFSTRAYAELAGLSVSSAAHRLKRFARRGFAQRLTRGFWVKPLHPQFTPYGCVTHLLGAALGYVSFLSALHRHGLLSQIPGRIQIATTGHFRRLQTALGTFEFFQIHPRMALQGVEWTGTPFPYRIAGPEKALLDTLYLATRKGRRFVSLPDLDRNACRFSNRLFRRLAAEQIHSPQIRMLVLTRAHALGFI
ncbi:MAG: hypothetical protein V1798_10060 [Pseudomonadota bacterium]